MERIVNATREELTQRCGHECLNQPDHDGPHFYGYRMGRYSYEGLLAENERLRGIMESASLALEEPTDGMVNIVRETLRLSLEPSL